MNEKTLPMTVHDISVRPRRATHWLPAATLAALLACLLAAVPVLAQNNEKTKQTVAMSQAVYEKLNEIQELVEAQKYAEAAPLLSEMQQRSRMSPYETAQVWNLTGYTYYLQERYAEAIEAYDRVLQQPDLPEALMLSSLKIKAQLQFTQEDYRGALRSVEQLLQQSSEPPADVYMLLGQAHFQLEDYDAALEPINTAVQMYRDQGNAPKENWLLLLRVIYYEKQDFQNMIGVLEELIRYYPKDTYLLTLAGAHSELGDTLKQLVIVEALYEKGFLDTQNHIVNLANLYLLHDAPYKAAKLLDQEIEGGRVEATERHLRLLSQAWYTAREDEKSIPPLARAASLSGDGELYVRLAQSHINLEQWDEAEDAIKRGLQLGGLGREDTANIMLGMALFNQKKFSLARRAFQAAQSDRRSRRAAEQWIAYVDSEIQRAELMNQDLPQRTTPQVLQNLMEEQEG